MFDSLDKIKAKKEYPVSNFQIKHKFKMQWIFFDCMETLVDFNPIPKSRDYAAWAFFNSGVEEFWTDFNQFFALFEKASSFLTSCRPAYKEWLTLDRFLHICTNTDTIKPGQIKSIALKLESSFFSSYCSKCFVQNDVKELLPLLSQKALLGVVSNFKVKNGIINILKEQNLFPYFKFVLSSAETGWRKPHYSIYQEALEMAGTSPDQILFIGDDPDNDVKIPKTLGMQALLLDRHLNKEGNESNQVFSSFHELCEIISNN